MVIGSGPAGLSTAMRLAERGVRRIAVIESGGLNYSANTQKLSTVTGESDLGTDHFARHSQRTFGGTSSLWGGWCTAMERRAFQQGEWAIEYEELTRYYAEAAEILELPSEAIYYPESVIEGCPQLVYKPFYLSNAVRFGTKYRGFIAAHEQIDLLVSHTCAKLVQDGAIVTEAVLRNLFSPGAEPEVIKADHFVLACGGVGNPRLLHLSGIAPASPVGLYLMEHPHLVNVAKIYLDAEKIQRYFPRRSRVVHALQLSTEHCVEQGLLSFSVSFDLDELHKKPLRGSARQLALTDVTVRSEMPPDPENRIELGQQIDALGQPRGRVQFHSRYDRLARRSWQTFSRQLLNSGLGRPAGLPSTLKIEGGGHLMGTTRMGLAESDSVVDGHCKVHTTDNLYIAGSSVFPAGGAAHPTLTIVALALRLGDHLAAVATRHDHG